MRALRAAFYLALVAGWVASLWGLLAPLWPLAEIGNDFRPIIIVCFIALSLLALLAGQRTVLRGGLAAAFFNGAILMAALIVAPRLASSESEGTPLKIVSFNMWVRNTHFAEVAEFLRRSDADVVFLQEMDEDNATGLLPALTDLYPHVLSCADVPYCGIVFLSKRPWVEASYEPAADGMPRMVRVKYGDELGGLTLVGTHLAMPFKADVQARNVTLFAPYAAALPTPSIVIGDFNLTPWTWRLTRFSMQTGLKRIGTWRTSWPAPHTVKGFPVSVFLIDHAFATGGISLEGWTVGPAIGSDHRPIAADFRIAGPPR